MKNGIGVLMCNNASDNFIYTGEFFKGVTQGIGYFKSASRKEEYLG